MSEVVEFHSHPTDAKNIISASTPTATASELFDQAVAVESIPNVNEAERLYIKVIELDPNFAAAHVNLGTIYYNSCEYQLAEEHYRKAVKIAPRYTLARFNLGNALDSLGRFAEAVAEYKAAIDLDPLYKDAHYNLAITAEKMGKGCLALRHWKKYIHMDLAGAWHEHAKERIAAIKKENPIEIVWRHPDRIKHLRKKMGDAKLALVQKGHE